ncbi:MAG: mechanosensitive ion channel family protein [Micavibrio sp.]|nr:MAG: mechanosensitive ion channel family protein [Micavibrio sp.]
MDINIDTGMLYELTLTYGVRLLTGVAIFYIGRWASGVISRLIRKGMERARLDKTIVTFVSNIAYYALFGFSIIAALSHMGIETTSLAALVAAAGLAVGLALQGSLSNFASGVMIVIFRPFRVGHFIEAAGTAGTVEALSIFTTTLRTPDNKIIIVPNKNISGGNITNHSAKKTRRIDLTFNIGYDDDLKKARKILEKLLKSDARILADPAPEIAVAELAEARIELAVRPWVKVKDVWEVRCALLEGVKREFDKAGFQKPRSMNK